MSAEPLGDAVISRSRHEAGWKTRDFLPDPSLTFPHLFARRLVGQPEAEVLSEVAFEGRDLQAVPHTATRMYWKIRGAAAALARAQVTSGDRVLICIEKASSFLAFFVAAQALGAVPVPLPSPSEFRGRDAFAERIRAVAADCSPRAVVVDVNPDAHGLVDASPGAALIDAASIEIPGDAALSTSLRFDRSFGDVAFIQYTSGSTGTPKGVVVTHGNLIANMRSSTEAAGFGPLDRGFSWLPLYHDMGLIAGLLLPLYLGIPALVMPTRNFVGRPQSWLRAMSRFRATYSCAPNFAFNLLAKRLPDHALAGLDLSAWRLAFNGAEPIDRSTIDAFVERFAPAGFSAETMFPVYGMAECTLAAAFPVPRDPPRYDWISRDELATSGRATPTDAYTDGALCFVSVGRVIPGHTLRIVDAAGTRELPERHVGEVAVSGPSISPYYFQRNGTYPPPRTELRTGDLGYVADDRLYIVDRLKDLLIIGGRNITPTDVERIVARVPGVRYGSVVAFSFRESQGTDELCILAGVTPQAVPDDVKQQVRAAVLLHLGVSARDVILVKPGSVPKTSSGKVRRTACRELYERHELARAEAPEKSDGIGDLPS